MEQKDQKDRKKLTNFCLLYKCTGNADFEPDCRDLDGGDALHSARVVAAVLSVDDRTREAGADVPGFSNFSMRIGRIPRVFPCFFNFIPCIQTR